MESSENKGLRGNRSRAKEVVLCASDVVGNEVRDNTEQSVSPAQVRQPEVRESEAPIPGDGSGQHDGYVEQEKALVEQKNALQERTSVIGTESDADQDPKVVSNLQKTSPSQEQAKNEIALDEQGILAPKNSSEEWRIADLYIKSKALPSHISNVPQAILILQFLKQLGLRTLASARQTAIINGSVTIWGDLPLSLCRRSGLMESFEEFLFDKEYKKICFDNKNLDAEVFGAICRTTRKGFTVTEFPFLVSDAKKANLWDKSIWKLYPKRMLQMRARTGALKDAFPDVLQGISISEYDDEIQPPIDVEPKKSSLNDKLDQAAGVA